MSEIVCVSKERQLCVEIVCESKKRQLCEEIVQFPRRVVVPFSHIQSVGSSQTAARTLASCSHLNKAKIRMSLPMKFVHFFRF
ncbi:hypothetical protein DPMN_095804 [Dreissena polymorpha]|uniref:Uncharacterized protein n=1 Tax=Dreissena polymorpha TaxID=45954 RepID=A0A9D4L769_DREPO|nr:hypothetical protein DPMN_095804 [Dreissena polymorpha]